MIAPAWISGTEVLLALVVGLLVFGGRLPEVLKDVGRWFFRLKRELEDIRRETGIDETLRELQSESRSIARDLEKAAEETGLPELDPHAPAREHAGPPEDARLEPGAEGEEGAWERREPAEAPGEPGTEDASAAEHRREEPPAGNPAEDSTGPGAQAPEDRPPAGPASNA